MWCSQSHDQLKEDLARFGYKLDMKYKYLIIYFLYFWLLTEIKYRNLANFTNFFSNLCSN